MAFAGRMQVAKKTFLDIDEGFDTAEENDPRIEDNLCKFCKPPITMKYKV